MFPFCLLVGGLVGWLVCLPVCLLTKRYGLWMNVREIIYPRGRPWKLEQGTMDISRLHFGLIRILCLGYGFCMQDYFVILSHDAYTLYILRRGVRLSVCLSVTLVYCVETTELINIKRLALDCSYSTGGYRGQSGHTPHPVCQWDLPSSRQRFLLHKNGTHPGFCLFCLLFTSFFRTHNNNIHIIDLVYLV